MASGKSISIVTAYWAMYTRLLSITDVVRASIVIVTISCCITFTSTIINTAGKVYAASGSTCQVIIGTCFIGIT